MIEKAIEKVTCPICEGEGTVLILCEGVTICTVCKGSGLIDKADLDKAPD